MSVYLVCGGSSGIGYRIAQNIVNLGNKVIVVSSNLEKLKVVSDQMGCEYVSCDLSDPYNIRKQLLSSLEAIEKKDGYRTTKLAGVIYSAGISPLCRIEDNEIELMEKTFHINVMSFIELVHVLLSSGQIGIGSKIIGIGSITARGQGFRQTLYGASKAALISAIKLMHQELDNQGIYVACVSPGIVDTPMLNKLRKESQGLNNKLLQGEVTPKTVNEVASVVEEILQEKLMLESGAEYVID